MGEGALLLFGGGGLRGGLAGSWLVRKERGNVGVGGGRVEGAGGFFLGNVRGGVDRDVHVSRGSLGMY